MHKSIIILNDLRATPIIASIKLKCSFQNNLYIAHESLFNNREYADYTPTLWKLCLKLILQLFFKLVIIKSNNRVLNEDEKMGYYSSFFSITNDSNASELKYPKIAAEIHRLATGSKDLIDFIKIYLPDNVFIFNGRTASSYLITKYCVRNKIKLFYYEFAGHLNGFRLFPVPPHAAGRLGELNLHYFKFGVFNIIKLLEASKSLKSQKLNSEHRKKSPQFSKTFFDVAIFLGSDFEYTSIDPEICEIDWSGNLNFCLKIVEKFGSNKSYAIRCHPNSEIDPNWGSLYEELDLGLKKSGVSYEIIGPNSKLDSYNLIDNCDILVTDLSTIALDFILLGRRVYIFGNTDIKYIYENDWFNKYSGEVLSDSIMLPFSLTHNFFVFRFSFIERFLAFFLFGVHRTFEKIVK